MAIDRENDKGYYTLTPAQYSKKYQLASGTVRRWLQLGYLDGIKRFHEDLGKDFWYLLDKMPEQHPGYKEKGIEEFHKPLNPESVSRRKVILKKNYLPVFLEYSNPQTERYTKTELANILTVSSGVIRTWETWGLKKSIYKGPTKLWKYPSYFGRQDIIDFLSGEWAKIREGIAKEATEAPKSDYYVYQHDKVFPIGYDGFMAWIKEMEVKREDKRKRAWVQVEFLPTQKEFFSNALELKENGDFRYQYICASRPRGEFKSFDVRLIFLFRFFNMYREVVVAAANSKDQSVFIQFDEATKTIEHSERLRNTPGLNMQKKDITLLEGKGKEFAKIASVASEQGLLPNTTCVVFTEICNLDNEGFYAQLTGSTRGIPNAMVLIDSTVAPRGHIFYRLHDTYQKREDPLIYFQHYADQHHNPETTPEFLAHQRRMLLPTEYNKYFRNRWEDAAGGVFTRSVIAEMGYLGLRVEVGG